MKIAKYYYLLAILLAFIAMYTGLRHGIISSFIMVCFALNIIMKSLVVQRSILSKIELLVLSYCIYNTISCVFTLINNYGMSVFVLDYIGNILPIVFLFIAIRFDDNSIVVFENVFLLVCSVLVVMGIYYNATLTDPHYLAFLETAYPRFTMVGFLSCPRLTAWVGSVVIGSLSYASIGLAFKRLSNNKKIFRFYIYFFISLLGALLSMQRSAMLAAIFIVITMLIYARKHRIIKIGYLVLLLSLGTIVTVIMLIKNPLIIEALFDRFSLMSSAISERNENWNLAFKTGISIIFGVGLGTGGHKAIGIAAETINDGNYFKMLYEIGIFGCLLFLTIVFETLKTGIKCYKTVGPYLVIVIGMLFQAVGSNILTFPLITPMFWYCIGIIGREGMMKNKSLMVHQQKISI